ncbi:MAG: transporter substrate-binding domain-containing protein, partial [Vicinamibacteria bacterium]|nr:transporter substrate-binding domain-containing protein [Vicinamibacteria bacterium]
ANARADDWAAIQARQSLRALVVDDASSADFFNLAPNPGDRRGFDREILESFCSLQKLKLETVIVPSWAELVPALKAGRGDVIVGQVTDTPERRQQIAFSIEVFPSGVIAVTRKPTPAIQSLDQLKSLKVGTIEGTSMAEAARALSLTSLDDQIPTGGIPDALRAGRIQVGIWGLESAILERRKDPAIQLGIFVTPPQSLAWGVRKQDVTLKVELDQFLGNLRKSPTWNRLVVKYFGESALELLKRVRQE